MMSSTSTSSTTLHSLIFFCCKFVTNLVHCTSMHHSYDDDKEQDGSSKSLFRERGVDPNSIKRDPFLVISSAIDIMGLMLLLGPLIYTLTAYPATTFAPWFFYSFVGFVYESVVLYFVCSLLNVVAYKRWLKCNKSPFDTHLHRMVMVVKTAVVVNCVG